MQNFSATKIIYTLPDPVWLAAAGMSKGIHHDRQHLNIILTAGDTLRIRQIGVAYTHNLTLRLLNTDAQTEEMHQVGSEWQSIKVGVTSVPFIDTPFGEGEPAIDIEFPATAKRLPRYRQGNDEAAFFSNWDNRDADFALLESPYVLILVPAGDKEVLRAPGDGQNIDSILRYYDEQISFFNALAGVSFEPDHPTDLNIANRYFLKADLHGAGAAYYGTHWTAESTSSVAHFWLVERETNWGAPHEIAHGYQGKFMNVGDFSTGEVWNNIYAASYQNVTMGSDVFHRSWLYENPARLFSTVTKSLATGVPVNQWGLREKLYFMMLMKDKAGDLAFARFNQQYRRDSNNPAFVAQDHTLLDLLSDSYARVGDIDVSPFIELAGASLGALQRERNAFSHARAVVPLSEILEAQQLDQAQLQLLLDSPLRLVDARQLVPLKLRGNVTVSFAIDHFEQIYAETLIVMDGGREAAAVEIKEPELRLPALPIGVYTLRTPSGKNVKYRVDHQYAVVKPGDTVLAIGLAAKPGSAVASQGLSLLGLGNEQFAAVTVDQARALVVVDVIASSPHVYFADEVYARIVVRDTSGATVFTRELKGRDVELTHDEIGFQFDFELEIHHQEPGNRLRVTPYVEGVVDTKAKTNVFVITPFGLRNRDLENDPAIDLASRIERAAVEVRQSTPMLHARHVSAKDDIFMAINLYTGVERERLLTQYADVISVDNAAPLDSVGNNFLLEFRGLGDEVFMSAELDFVLNEARIRIYSVPPHLYFSDTYAYLSLVDRNGDLQFSYDFIGNQKSMDLTLRLPLASDGGTLYLEHQEAATRLLLTNRMQGKRLNAVSGSIIRIGPNGLYPDGVMDGPLPPPAVRGNFFEWQLLGDADHLVARITIDLTTSVIGVDILDTVPDPAVAGVYLRIFISDREGVNVFDRSLRGDAPSGAEFDAFALRSGCILGVDHWEASRSKLINLETSKHTRVSAFATFKLVAKGLSPV